MAACGTVWKLQIFEFVNKNTLTWKFCNTDSAGTPVEKAKFAFGIPMCITLRSHPHCATWAVIPQGQEW